MGLINNGIKHNKSMPVSVVIAPKRVAQYLMAVLPQSQ